MTMLNQSWNGSTCSFGGAGVTPLVDLHQPNEPADFDTTGSTDGQHTHGTGLPKNSFNISFLGSKAPDAGTVCAITTSIGASSGNGGSPVTASYGQAMISQLTISGRKDSRIEGSMTVMPAVSALSATSHTWPIGDLGFNGSTFSFNSAAFASIAAAQYTASATPIEGSGAEDADNFYSPGIPDQTITITTLGAPQCAAKSTGATVMSWNDGGTLGTSPGGITAECVSTNPGGAIDGQATTVHVFRYRRTGAGNS